MSDDRLLRNSYRFFTADHDVGDAVRAFRARYGVLPTEKPFSDGRYLYVGPVPRIPVIVSENMPADTVAFVNPDGSGEMLRLFA